MNKLGNIIWATVVAAGAVWLLLAFTAVGFPLVVAVMAAAAIWMLVELALIYRQTKRSDELTERATP